MSEPTSGNEPLKASDLDTKGTQKALDKAAKTEEEAAEARLYDGPPASGSEDVERVGTEYSEAAADDPTGQNARFAASEKRVAAKAGGGDAARDTQVKHEREAAKSK